MNVVRIAVVAMILSLVTFAGVATAQYNPPELDGLRGAPLAVSATYPPVDVTSYGAGQEFDARPPDGVQALPVDVFTTTDFYLDRDLWLDQRYWRCNAPRMMADLRSGGAGVATADPRIGANEPVSARWGNCDEDWPRENILSPYSFDRAGEHYAALLAEVESRGGPTQHTYETMPKWDGAYGGDGTRRVVWNYMRANQMPTILSLLTPEHQQHMVQQIYHEGVDGAHQWSIAYCYPEGFMRQWATGAGTTAFNRLVVTPEVVLMLGTTNKRTVMINREFPLAEGPPQWYGDTIGFWDGDALITMTSNVQGWNQHSSWEWSDALETVEIFTPVNDAAGNLIGLDWEAVIYDSQALVEPVRLLWYRGYQHSLSEEGRFSHTECIGRFYPIEGRATPVAPGEIIQFRVPDMGSRPWAESWEVYFEEGMQRPQEELDLGFN